MPAPSNRPGDIVTQDLTGQDAWDEVATAFPVSQAEIDDLLYGEDRRPEERLARLQEIAETLRGDAPGDISGNDYTALLGEVQDAIARLGGAIDRDPDMPEDEVQMDDDPLNHRETLSPDDDELLDLEEAEDEDDDELGVLDDPDDAEDDDEE